jgi:hypothetical protein
MPIISAVRGPLGHCSHTPSPTVPLRPIQHRRVKQRPPGRGPSEQNQESTRVSKRERLYLSIFGAACPSSARSKAVPRRWP